MSVSALFTCLYLVCGAFHISSLELLPSYDSRILNGRPVTNLSVVAIEDQHRCICSGTLITPNCILTAAHCVVGMTVKKLRVILASSNARFGKKLRVKRKYVPGGYNMKRHTMDVAILQLHNSISTTTPVIIDYNDMTMPGTKLTIYGWGDTGRLLYDFFGKPRLRVTNVRVYNTTKCRRAYKLNKITDNMFCALGKNGNDACEGDSGGPAINSEGKQVGIISFGQVCSTENHIPGVYTKLNSPKVSKYLQEIISKRCTS